MIPQNEGETPLMFAAFFGRAEVCKELLAAGADPRHKDKRKFDALLCAAQKRHVNVVSMLLACNADPETTTETGANCVWLALSEPADAVSAIEHYIEHGMAPLVRVQGSGISTMHRAAMYGQLNSIILLCKLGIEAKLRDSNEWTPLHYAALYEYLDVISCLVKYGADVNARDIKGRTSLHTGARGESASTIRCLLDLNADINAKDNFGWTALIHACSFDLSRMTVQGHGKGHDTTSCVGELLQSGARVNARTRRGLTALHFSSVCGRVDLVNMLILWEANVDSKTFAGRTPLHLAAMSNRADVVHALASHGADTGCMDTKGNSALHSAAARGHNEAVSALLELGAVLGARNRAGRSALDLAARSGHQQTASILMALGMSNLSIFEERLLTETAIRVARRHKRHEEFAPPLTARRRGRFQVDGGEHPDDPCVEDDDVVTELDEVLGGEVSLVESIGLRQLGSCERGHKVHFRTSVFEGSGIPGVPGVPGVINAYDI